MKLAWDSSQFKITINHIDIHIAGEQHLPFPVSAVVTEQDTSLILEPDDEIRDPGNDKPAWYMANTLEYQALHKPGDIILKSGSPDKLWAIVHNLDFTPSWRSEWIARALENILELSRKKPISSIRLPVLGSQFGHFKLTEFITLLVKILNTCEPTNLQRIWLLVPDKDCQTVFTLLKKLSR